MAQPLPAFIQSRSVASPGQLIFMPAPQIVPMNQYFINYYNQPDKSKVSQIQNASQKPPRIASARPTKNPVRSYAGEQPRRKLISSFTEFNR